MAEPRSDDRSQARREAAILLGVDIEHLSAADSLRVDMISALRLVIDHEQATVLDGGGADLGKLNVAVQSLIALLPGRELPEPASSRPDPREIMLRTYRQMRERGQIPPEGTLQAKINEQAAEIAALKAQLAGLPDVPTLVETVPAPAGANVVPLPKPPSAPAAAPAARATAAPPQYDYNKNSDWKNYVNSDGSIRSTPRGRWDI
jgi:hypothetical protein